MTMPHIPASLRERLEIVASVGTYEIPNGPGWGGTGAPGKLLERLLEIDGKNKDRPDADDWELKWAGAKKGLMTMFHLDGQPKGYIERMIDIFGINKGKERSFRQTLGKHRNKHGLSRDCRADRIEIFGYRDPVVTLVNWTHDSLLNAFVSKMRRVIVVSGTRTGRKVTFREIKMYWEPKSTQFIAMVESGQIAIDFDAKKRADGSVRNHGTKFRVPHKDFGQLYRHEEEYIKRTANTDRAEDFVLVLTP